MIDDEDPEKGRKIQPIYKAFEAFHIATKSDVAEDVRWTNAMALYDALEGIKS